MKIKKLLSQQMVKVSKQLPTNLEGIRFEKPYDQFMVISKYSDDS